MKILYDKPNTQAFRYLMMGDTFSYEDEPYIKCDLGESSSNAVSLRTGRKVTVDLDYEVLPLSAVCCIGRGSDEDD